jgi:hypothetical protein
MNDISIEIPFDSTKERISAARKELVSEVYRGYLGRHPTKNDASRFQQRINADNKSINDQYFDGKKVGNLMTTYILDIPRYISIRFNQAG